ncbi:MAG: hypothetical protein GX957_04880 [Clostridiaceae bacterium]|nr:hypothetical protein [Clostridiaceae bacterium]
MSILRVEENKACPEKNVEIRKMFLVLLVENTSILAIRKPQLAYCKLRFSGLFGTY